MDYKIYRTQGGKIKVVVSTPKGIAVKLFQNYEVFKEWKALQEPKRIVCLVK